ncbi:TetR/AcrR family transcriptional regulator [Nonomuraea aridisoli]|uniref:TetR family transcriptional regulator n=1 Tax=Nonomuraea aridisoli TaxID=2070368 RepID=A0A2W2G9N2_9ACTN|nr:TetR/AcrR family transcriptional regulator [Nonomuraea aridisoli]PZG23514.1 TetR family transcriptional regulator [Nonomuraea aridisoli]
MTDRTPARSELPSEARLWRPSSRSTDSARGRPPGYSRAQIAEAAIKIADAEGVEALSMRKVATALGTGAMSLYRYVKNKEALCQLMVDHMVGQAVLPERTGEWRTDLRALAVAQRMTQLAHPWLAGIAAGRPTMGPNTLRMLEHGMSILDGLGLSLAEMLEIYSLISSWVNGFVREELTEEAVRERSGLSVQEWRQNIAPYIENLMSSGDYPYFTRIVREGIDHDFDMRFERGLDRIIAGIAATLPSR